MEDPKFSNELFGSEIHIPWIGKNILNKDSHPKYHPCCVRKTRGNKEHLRTKRGKIWGSQNGIGIFTYL